MLCLSVGWVSSAAVNQKALLMTRDQGKLSSAAYLARLMASIQALHSVSDSLRRSYCLWPSILQVMVKQYCNKYIQTRHLSNIGQAKLWDLSLISTWFRSQLSICLNSPTKERIIQMCSLYRRRRFQIVRYLGHDSKIVLKFSCLQQGSQLSLF